MIRQYTGVLILAALALALGDLLRGYAFWWL